MAREAFLTAVKASDVATMREILARDPDSATAPGPDGLTPLLVAIYHRRRDAVDVLLEHGALGTAHEAAAFGDAEALQRFVEDDPSVLARPGADGAFPLHLAAHFGHDALVRGLAAMGADVDAMCGPVFSNMPLHAACAGRAVGCVEALLGLGADVDVRDAGGHSPLHIAAANGDRAIIDLLLGSGADPRAKNKTGKTPRDIAAERGVDEVLALLPASDHQ